MIQTGLYAVGSDPVIDRAVEVWPMLDAFITEKAESCVESFEKLKIALGKADEVQSNQQAQAQS